MAQFGSAPVESVLPASKTKSLGERAVIAKQYREAMKTQFDAGMALVVDLEEGDKPLTVKNRLSAAIVALGYSGKAEVRKTRNKPQFYAYLEQVQAEAATEGASSTEGEGEDTPEVEAPKKPKGAKAHTPA
jgi:hypothetical protein